MKLTMNNLIKSITQQSIIRVKGNWYKPIAKVHYITQSCPDNEYVKVFMEGHYALVISPDDEFMYFGKDVGEIPNTPFPSPEKLCYNSVEYQKIVSDYQIVKHVEFGNLLETEGEVVFTDYQNTSSENGSIISLGLIVRTQKRADIVAAIINIDDVFIN